MTYPHSATLLRNTKVNGRYTFAENGSTSCFLQPLEEQESQLVGITFGKGSHAYVPYETDVKEGDRAVIDDITYGVKGLRSHNYGNLKHKRILLEAL